MSAAPQRHWTVDDAGHANNSRKFLECVDAIVGLLKNGGYYLINGHHHTFARLVMAQLAHKHGLGPSAPPHNQAKRRGRGT